MGRCLFRGGDGDVDRVVVECFLLKNLSGLPS
jgi:hypothetical protein